MAHVVLPPGYSPDVERHGAIIVQDMDGDRLSVSDGEDPVESFVRVESGCPNGCHGFVVYLSRIDAVAVRDALTAMLEGRAM